MSQNPEKIYDIFVAGGGINGIGVARDAAGRGYSVCLCEMNDFASGTSSNSTKLIHSDQDISDHHELVLLS
jgi:glycerol-3-phosphate dehydrogenase